MALKDKKSDVRSSVTDALGKIKDPRAVEPLIVALKDEDPNVRSSAKKALVKLGKPAVKPLIVALKDKKSGVRKRAAELLGKIKDPRAVTPLIVAATLKDMGSIVRVEAENALVKIGKSAVEPLIVALRDKKSDIRAKAAWALGEIKDSRAVEPLIVTLKDKKSDVRAKAAWALGEIKDSRAVEPLIVTLKDKKSDVRRKAAEILVEMKDPRAAEPLLAAFSRKDLAVVAGAYCFFICRGEPGTEPILIKALNKYGTKKMAEDFLNCGNAELTKAGHMWANRHGYKVSSSPDAGGPVWGSSR